jgi:site-specific DNA recombinase
MTVNEPHETSRHTDIDQTPIESNSDNSVSKAAIYVRTSASKPKFHYSIGEQISRCWNRCEQQGWDVEFVFKDEEESGKNTDRPAFQDMLEKAELGCFDVVVFWKLDRFCRSLTDLVKTEEKLDESDVALHSVTEYIDTSSPVGRFNFRNLASAAELESDLTSQRVRIGMHGMAKEHRWPNDRPPLGYDLADDQTLEVNEDEADLVRRIFRMYIEERSMPEVAHNLNKRGIKTKQAGEWSRWSVKKILANELYRGKYELGKYENFVEEYQIVSDDLFEEVTETRLRFQHENGEMGDERKQSKADKILSSFKEPREDSE